jgi:hypothetical protein
MEVDVGGFDSDVTPTAAIAARASWAGGSGSASKPGTAAAAAVDDEEMNAAAAVLLSGFKRAGGGQVGAELTIYRHFVTLCSAQEP